MEVEEIEIIDETPNQQPIVSSSSNSSSSLAPIENDSAARSQEIPSPLPTPRQSSTVVGSPTSSGRVSRRTTQMDILLQQAARLGLTSKSDKFLQNFNPENSNREKRKLTRKIVQPNKRCYDAKGILLAVNKDLCDCLHEKCPGCFFPCPKCRSCKCGHECRQLRKWVYESAEVQGSKRIIFNPYKDLLKKKP